MASVLVVDDIAREKARDLREYALGHRVDQAAVARGIAGTAPPIGDDPAFVRFFEVGFRVVFSIELLPLKAGGSAWYQHFSCSHASGKRPHPATVRELLGLFEIVSGFESYSDPVIPHAINVVAPLGE